MELYNAIFYRKSIKNYSNNKIEESLMREVKQACSDITYLNEGLNIKAHLIDRGHIIHFLMGKQCRIKSPHYIILTSNKGEDYLQNIGYAGEEIILRLTSLGIGTCWVESNLKRDDIIEIVQLDEIDEDEENIEDKIEKPYALIAFGYPEKNEELFKDISGVYDRNEVKDISKRTERKWYKVLKAVRLAPSIKNSQPWMFYSDKLGFHMYEKKQNKNIRDLSKISMGIALRHFDIACKHYDIDVEYKNIKAKKRVRKQYFKTIELIESIHD